MRYVQNGNRARNIFEKAAAGSGALFQPAVLQPFCIGLCRPDSFWSVILHVGRRSGKVYSTPIVAARQNSTFVIPLPYGWHVDWFRNVMAAGGCDLIYRGRVYRASVPEIIPIEEGLVAFSGRVQALLRRSDTESLLRLNQFSETQDGETRYDSFTASYPLARGPWVLAALGFFAVGIWRLVARRK